MIHGNLAWFRADRLEWERRNEYDREWSKRSSDSDSWQFSWTRCEAFMKIGLRWEGSDQQIEQIKT
ncbi:predicted protein [Sclerotinia sclerotiorum 1980 UF-70]|uniref:Uncharacterized protein n=1 Tax=Sclerotinia sclerotiorum (strain ATCC 18683 / 1980 / Ss-1) TaxID=665079 RepID=A7E4K7_SCLS1|nr:predicted protein [Sclerotinia sclerotiorum 1980 UF-70]EDN90829.1 predicted protein [Sclerotinia sclerotiorum 1980 UF-70]